MHLADGCRGKGFEIEGLEELIEVGERPSHLELHHFGGNPRSLLLQRTQNLGHLGREQTLVQAQHLTDLHGRSLELTQGLDDPERV